ncbi:hypothetical protein FRB90_004227 [Tulasnella sp. 427]|nr:hypothetical protein FRB90_004227 [Tulasnella sp. 427]
MMFRNSKPRGKLLQNISSDLQAACLEFCGTFVFLLFALGGVQAMRQQNALQLAQSGGPVNSTLTIPELVFSSAAFGLSLLFSVWLFYRVTGGIFNPNVTTALLLTGVIGPLVGAIAASAVLLALLPGPLNVNTVPSKGVSKSQAVFIEMFVTAALVLSVLMLAAEKHRSTPFAPVGIGLTLFACELFAIVYTGGSVNTARSFGPAVVSGFDASHWVYWVGPFLGSLLAVGLYSIFKHIPYWTINPDQDSIDVNKSPSGPVDTIRGTIARNPSRTDAEGGSSQRLDANGPTNQEDYPTGIGPQGYEKTGRPSEATAV